MSPEQLVDRWRKLFVSPAYKSRLVGVIIDEAHCIVKWFVFTHYLNTYTMFKRHNYYFILIGV